MRRKDRQVSRIEQIKRIIGQCKTCHIAMVDEGKPYVEPLSFGYEILDDTLILYLHSAKDDPCNSGYDYSSIIGNGHVEFIMDSANKCKALTLLMKQQADIDVQFTDQQADSVCVFKIISNDFTGKKKDF